MLFKVRKQELTKHTFNLQVSLKQPERITKRVTNFLIEK
mgnify:CR=1 FL=1